ncbi:MAG: transposase, partial [Parcubacteria group bacterium]
MGLRNTNFITGEYYHIYNRGNSKQKIFLDQQDYKRFVKLLYIANSIEKFHLFDSKNPFQIPRTEQLINIGSYCLMPNHFHLLITPSDKQGEQEVSLFMKKLGTAYSMYFNTKYKRVGSLFEGKFKSKHINSDRHLKYLFSYIHLNPLKIINKEWRENGIKNKKQSWLFLENYKYSSFIDYSGITRIEEKILNKEAFPKYFPSP